MRGISTVVGTVLFVMVIMVVFSSYLVYTFRQMSISRQILGSERNREVRILHAQPILDGGDFNVCVWNRGNELTHLVSLWFLNRTYHVRLALNSDVYVQPKMVVWLSESYLPSEPMGLNYSQFDELKVVEASGFIDETEYRISQLTIMVDGVILYQPPPPIPYLWISCGDDWIYKVAPDDPTVAVANWSTATSRPYGVEYVDGYIYYVDPGWGADRLYKTVDGTGEVVASWDISGYSGDAYGLGWNGTHFFIADAGDDYIYVVDPADPTTYVARIRYAGIGVAEGVTWDGQCLWVADSGADEIFQIDTSGTVISSFTWAAGSSSGITWDGEYLWITDDATNRLYKVDTIGTIAGGPYDDPSTDPQGLTYHG